MLKILNNDKFTTAQNRHSLVSLKIPILNTLPYRAKGFIPWYPGRCPGLGTDCPFRALLFALCSFIMCACFATCCLAKKRAEIFLDFEHLRFLGGRAFGTGGMSVLAVCRLSESQEVFYFLITPLPN